MADKLVDEVMALARVYAEATTAKRINMTEAALRTRLTELLAGEPEGWLATTKKGCDFTRLSPIAERWISAKYNVKPLYLSPAAATAALQDVLASIQEALEDNDINGAMLMTKTLRAALAKEPKT